MFHRLIALVLLFASPVSACIWDYDTLRDEQRGLPGVFEIISRRYERRSNFFYRDRIQKMRQHLESKPDDRAAIDNLAVALFRTNERENAIALMHDKEKRFPDQYTTASNLATFHMLSGDNAAAVPLLEKAIKINSDAHFGREKYQLLLAKFLVEAKAQSNYPTVDFLGRQPFYLEDGKVMQDEGKARPDPRFMISNWNASGPLPEPDTKAMEGIIGMIRFGTDGSPDLWYALGNLLVLKGDRHLAIRAYTRGVEAGHPRANDITELINGARSTIGSNSPTAEQIREERDAGQAWAQAYMAHADDLIRAGKDPEVEMNYVEFYKKAGKQAASASWQLGDLIPGDPKRTLAAYALIAIAAGLVLIATVRILKRLKRRSIT